MVQPIPCGDITTKEECIANPDCKYIEPDPPAVGYCREKTILEKYWQLILALVIVIIAFLVVKYYYEY